MKNIFGILFVFIASVVAAQDDIARELNNLRWGMEVREAASTDGENIEGSPFWDTEFLPSKVYIKNNAPLEINLRLNAHEHYFEFKNKATFYALKSSEVDSISYGDDIYVFKALNSKKEKEIFPLAIVSKKQQLVLYRMNKIRFIRAKEEQVYKDAQPSKYLPVDPEYFIELNDELTPLKTFNTLYKQFPKQKKSIKNYVQANKIKRNSETDLIKLVHFLEEKNGRK